MDHSIPGQGLPEPDDAQPATPPTETASQLVPPPRKPPTAVAVFSSGPEPRPPRPVARWGGGARVSPLVGAVNTVLDVLDEIGDAVRAAAIRAAS
jgi:hypothetical protein